MIPSSRMLSQTSPLRAESCDVSGSINRLPAIAAFLDADPRPTIIVPINEIGPIPFELFFCNEAFRKAGLQSECQGEEDAPRRFRSWTQTVMHWREELEFAGRRWTAFKIQGHWKCVQSSGVIEDIPSSKSKPYVPEDTARALEEVTITDVRLASLYKMMEMSDVGTFEYTPQGTLLRANESWYRLSLHPRIGVERRKDFSFMDLVYPPDGPLVLSQWNKLTQGIPVTFEMRWKGKNYDNSAQGGVDDYQWVLSACVPIMDEAGNLVSIAGNTIDINAQKIVAEEALQRAEALERARASERKFARFALLAPIAIYICNAQGKMMYCNNRFFELIGHSSASSYEQIDWDSVVFPEDQEIVDKQWMRLLHDKQRTQAYFRLKHTWDIGDGKLRQAWIESQAFPELDDEGNVVSIFGTMTDISRFKWAEEIQKTRMEEALEAKRKHENFIDMTSHEMRNPLSAVIQCADSTIDSMKMVLSHMSTLTNDDAIARQIESELKICLDSLNTIISCSIHQKRVIDDVLTLSKMDSNLLAITPVRVEPATIVAEAVHMFELECNKGHINMSFVEDPSLQELGAQHVMMDPSRVLQVLINLLTNAIKFTEDRPIRNIKVILGASWSRPDDGMHDMSYAHVSTEASGLLDSSEWGCGRKVYIWIQCHDTGCGMSIAEQGNLFTRFSQATPRTHIRYGGSGLGLFISKKLTELQGGAIGVRSETNVGSTFSFFVATRISSPPTPGCGLEIPEGSLARIISKETRVTLERSINQPIGYIVLVVEDNLVNQKVLSQQLRKAGCQVFVANHGQEALDFLRQTEYWCSDFTPPSTVGGSTQATAPVSTGTIPSADRSSPSAILLTTPPESSEKTQGLSDSESQPTGISKVPQECIKLSAILMDIEMPVMDGLTCTRQIRHFQDIGQIKGHIPIMAVSANARSEQVAQARAAGMDDAISKPFRIPELIPKLAALVQGDGPLMVLPNSTSL